MKTSYAYTRAFEGMRGSVSLERQREAVSNLAEVKGLTVKKWFHEPAGQEAPLPVLAQLFRESQEDDVEGVLVYVANAEVCRKDTVPPIRAYAEKNEMDAAPMAIRTDDGLTMVGLVVDIPNSR